KREEECLYFLQQKENYTKKSIELLLILCNAGDICGNYRVPTDILSKSRDIIANNPILLKNYIRYIVKDSKFDLASKMLVEMERLYPDSKEFLEARLSLQIALRKDVDAMNTSSKILEIDPGDLKAAELILTSMYSNGNYKQFLDNYDKSINETITDQFRTKAASAVLIVNGIDSFLQYCKKYGVSLIDRDIIKSMFSAIRFEDNLKKLGNSIDQENDMEKKLFKILNSWIRGIPIDQESILPILSLSCSETLSAVYMLCEGNSSDSNGVKLASTCGGKFVSNLLGSLKKIREGIYEKNMVDFPYLNFQLTNLLISMKKVKEASDLLIVSTNSRNPDPYYYFLDGVISKSLGNNNAAEKSIEKALELLEAVPFLKYVLSEYIRNDDKKHVISTSERIIKMGAFTALPFGEIYEYSRKNDSEFSANMIDLFDYAGDDNIYTLRFRRDHFIETLDDEKASSHSKQIIAMKDCNARDVMTYLAILKRSGKGTLIEDVIEVLAERQLNGEVYASFGDYYQSKGEYENAVYHYRKGMEAGYDPNNMPGFPDCLIELKKYQEAADVLSRIKEKGILEIKLFARSGNIEKVVSLIREKKDKTKFDDEVFSFIVLTLWKNSEVRDSLINLYEKWGNPTLGKLISRKLLDSKDLEGSIRIMRNVLKNAPLDIENIVLLSETLAKLGREEEATAILRKSLKEISKKEDTQQLFNVLTEINYNAKLHEEVMKAFEDYPMLITKDSLNYIIRSMIELEFYDKAEKLISRLHNKLISQDRFDEYHELLKKREEMAEILYFAVKIMKLEFKAGRKLDQREAIVNAEIPVEIAHEVFEFFEELDENIKLPQEAYDALSKERP
ncbi:MAG: tetratricopeptide repeat protein, partial [Thermoplasmataceae archaeon]